MPTASREWLNQLVSDALVVSLDMVVSKELGYRPTKMPFPQQERGSPRGPLNDRGHPEAEGIPPSRERPTRLSELDLSGIRVGRLDLSALGPNEIVDTAPQGSPSA